MKYAMVVGEMHSGKECKKKLREGLVKTLGKNPGKKNLREYNKADRAVDPKASLDIKVDFFREAAEDAKDMRFRQLTSTGQCEGQLVLRDNDIILCCCEDMAGLFAYCGAYHHDGIITVPAFNESAEKKDSAIYTIKHKLHTIIDRCPFCGASIVYIEHFPIPDKEGSDE